MKIRSFARKAIVLALLAGAAVGANASTNITTLGPATPGVPLPFNGYTSDVAFADFFKFVLPANSGSGYTVQSFDIEPYLSSQLTVLTLFSNPDGILNNTDDLWLGQYGTGTPKKLDLSFGTLAAGNYYLFVSGVTSGTLGGAYNGAISVTAVPEPESYALFLAGLGIMGAIARRRSKANAV